MFVLLMVLIAAGTLVVHGVYTSTETAELD
jgi:hypothetical protein